MKNEKAREKKRGGFKLIICLLLLILMLVFCFPSFIMANTDNSETAATESGTDTVVGEESVEVKAEDAESKEEINELKEQKGVLLFADNDRELNSLSSPAPATDRVYLSYNKLVRYEGYSTHYFKVKYDGRTKVAYCVQPREKSPSRGTWTAYKYNNKMMMKALYYSYGYPGYDRRMRPYLSKKDIDDDYTDDYGAYALSHMILSYIYDNESINSDAFIGVGRDTKSLVKTVTAKIEKEWPDPPVNQSLSLSRTSVTASWERKTQKQKTPVMKLKGHSDNRIYMTVPAYSTLVKTSGGVTKKYPRGKDNSLKVKVFAGDTFYFTAPPSVKGTYKSPKMEGVLSSFQPYIIKVTGRQNIVFCGVGATSSVSFTINWAKLGTVVVKKSSSDKKTTQNNNSYSLKNAEYGLYKKSTGDLYGKLTTNNLGEASIANVPYGAYYLKEIKAPKGYKKSTSRYDVTLNTSKITKNVYNIPGSFDVDVIVKKTDKESGNTSSAYVPSVKDAHYRINYYDEYFDNVSQLGSIEPERSWVVETDETGNALMDEAHFVEGDNFYKDDEGSSVIPLGTVTVQEIKAPEGYLLDDEIFMKKLSPESAAGAAGEGESKNFELEPVIHEEQLVRGDVEFVKISGKTNKRIKNIPFTLTAQSTGESVTICTDEKGKFSTVTGGTWFGEGEWRDGKGALPYGKYLLTELRCENNIGLQLIENMEIDIKNDGEVVELGRIIDNELKLHTSAADGRDGDRTVAPGSHACITDRVEYSGLKAGRDYIIKGVLMDKEKGKPVIAGNLPVKAEKAFTAAGETGIVDVRFEFDASQLYGKTLVVFEELYYEGQLIAKHDDINSREQTVQIEDIKTGPETGDTTPWFLIVISVTIAAVCGLTCLIRRGE